MRQHQPRPGRRNNRLESGPGIAGAGMGPGDAPWHVHPTACPPHSTGMRSLLACAANAPLLPAPRPTEVFREQGGCTGGRELPSSPGSCSSRIKQRHLCSSVTGQGTQLRGPLSPTPPVSVLPRQVQRRQRPSLPLMRILECCPVITHSENRAQTKPSSNEMGDSIRDLHFQEPVQSAGSHPNQGPISRWWGQTRGQEWVLVLGRGAGCCGPAWGAVRAGATAHSPRCSGACPSLGAGRRQPPSRRRAGWPPGPAGRGGRRRAAWP